MGVGAIFLIFVIIVVFGGIAAALLGVGGGLWGAKTSPSGDKLEGGSRYDDEHRPTHTVVEDGGGARPVD
jgi:hypothetical protein